MPGIHPPLHQHARHARKEHVAEQPHREDLRIEMRPVRTRAADARGLPQARHHHEDHQRSNAAEANESTNEHHGHQRAEDHCAGCREAIEFRRVARGLRHQHAPGRAERVDHVIAHVVAHRTRTRRTRAVHQRGDGRKRLVEFLIRLHRAVRDSIAEPREHLERHLALAEAAENRRRRQLRPRLLRVGQRLDLVLHDR